ncbi:MAG: patatin-like phospholipase family protein [Flavobacteriales bacterium]|nr:patatin-like phospholipase family protein [Flavobacteriales bacterium]
MKKRALVISGGGSKGAFAGGMIEFLITQMKLEYDLFIGTSTGALLTTLFASEQLELAKKAFTTTSQEDIFDVNPFKIKRDKYGTSLNLNHYNIIKQFVNKKKTFGESRNLRKLIKKYFTQDLYDCDCFRKKEIYVTVSNLSTNGLEYKKLQDYSLEDVIDWVWISCNYAPFMSIVKKENNMYADGGYADFIAIDKAIEEGATHIDAILLDPEDHLVNYTNFNNPFTSIFRINDFMFNRIQKLEVENAILKCSFRGIKLKIHYLPYILTDNSLIFNPEKMRKWWDDGYQYMMKSVFSN